MNSGSMLGYMGRSKTRIQRCMRDVAKILIIINIWGFLRFSDSSFIVFHNNIADH